MATTKDAPKVDVGNVAPDFTLTNQDGKSVSLSDFKGKQAVVLYFYPKDNTPGCTAEACSFRDSYEVFQEIGAEVIGVSSDSEGSHQGFAAKHRLPFVLLSDQGGEVRKLYGVSSWFGIFLPKSAPAPIVDTLNKEIKVFLEREDTKRNIAAMGARTDYGTPQQFSDFVQGETTKFAAIIEKEGLQMEVR